MSVSSRTRDRYSPTYATVRRCDNIADIDVLDPATGRVVARSDVCGHEGAVVMNVDAGGQKWWACPLCGSEHDEELELEDPDKFYDDRMST